jgi:cytochrome c oxidase cbb3-type subunit 2
VVATEKAKELVAYILSLKQVPIPGAATAVQPTHAAANEAGSQLGASVYASRCASCHGPDGTGVPGVFPALKGDAVVTDADPTSHIRIVLFGLQGKTINGAKYASPMPAHKGLLSDEEIVAVINHERTSWGNSAPTITQDEVERVSKQGQTAHD